MNEIILAWDSETERFREGCMAPPLVCLTWQMHDRAAGKSSDAYICDRTEAHARLTEWLTNKRYLHVLQNAAYDMAVICAAYPELVPLVFQAYEDGRVTDTMTRAQLIDIAGGVYRTRRYNLESLAQRDAGMTLQKDAWRTSYGLFKDVPLSGWVAKAKEVQGLFRAELEALQAEYGPTPPTDSKAVDERMLALRESIEADPYQVVKYPLDDARATLAVYLAQERHSSYLDNQYEQAYAAFALHLSSAWGIRTDAQGVKDVQDHYLQQLAELEGRMIEAGFVRANGSKDTKAVKAYMAQVLRDSDKEWPYTDAHFKDGAKCGGPAAGNCVDHLSIDSAACEASEDFLLLDYAKMSTAKKVLSNDVKMLQLGTVFPIHPRYGMAESGRTTCSGPNIQNMSNK